MPPSDSKKQQYALQDRLFSALERLEIKETQAAAFQELLRLVKDLDVGNLSSLLHAAGTQTAKTTQFARVHSLRLATLCTAQQHCMQWRAMLQPPLLTKLLGLLARALRDTDSAVRAAACEGFGLTAQQLAAAYPGSDATAGHQGNPLLACILEALGEPGGAVQAAAACALGQVADHLQPLDPQLLRQLLRNLNNSLFLGRAELWQAVARLEEGRVHGLVASSCQQLLEVMPEVLGGMADGTGLLGALVSRGKDFQLRAAAANTIKALAVGVGPLSPGCGWDAACTALKAAKTDVSKPVRDAALAALPVLTSLQEFVGAGVEPQQWPAVCGCLLAASAGRSKRAAAPAAKPKLPKAVGGADSASCRQFIPAAAVYVDTAAPPAQSCPVMVQPQAQHGVVLVPPHGMLAAAAPSFYPANQPMGYAVAPRLPPVAAAMQLPASSQPAHLPTTDPHAASQLAAQLTAMQQQQAHMAAALNTLTACTQGSLRQLQQHIMSVGAGVAALTGGLQAPQLQQYTDPVGSSMGGMGGVGGLEASMGSMHLHQEQHQQPQMAPAGPGMHQMAAPPVLGASSSSPKRLSSLHRSYDALDRELHRKQQRQQPDSQCHGATRPALQHPTSSGSGAAPGVAAGAASARSSAGGSCTVAAASWEATYSQLLSSGSSPSSDQQLQLKLLRSMVKSGPVWEQLSSATAQRLMQAIHCFLKEGTALKRLLPWLWPLADTSSTASKVAAAFPSALRQDLLAALAAYPLPPVEQDGCCSPVAGDSAAGKSDSSSSSQLAEKRELLLSALRAVWHEARHGRNAATQPPCACILSSELYRLDS